ncbi:polysaccharide deacetylase family protein [Burkholderia vietnamiensis]|uniref:polysaccharide deacetylase family protein n=1 Tax=Burkholderia vietnamiensis TaxID=60552 RepID=UPI000759C90D|nr:polysaccharide deacetylase family protein [Burkholderia vietnamiensis]KVE54387.1 polysaccharide deacetylase [Burkholderia vietnamiensis]KVE83061.1 polysaccharide deacetylase [Burkholderia vietnamiensis]MDN7924876.1 polysaccharide deacetylase family protein [Burkholderia vietnamiensis]HDR9249588.1 polysaccharide deacetylase family protein [Burkholderia vietnamiensis]
MALRMLVCLLLLSCVPPLWAADDAGAGAPQPQRVLILVYHRFATTRVDSMTVRIDTLRDQLQAIDANGYRIVPLADVVRWQRGDAVALPARAVAITVDDGHRSVYDVLRPLLAAHPMPVTLFVYPSAISNAGYAMTWDQLRALGQSADVAIESHTYWHPNFHTERARQTPADYRRFVSFQLRRSRERLEAEIGRPVTLLAWPFGVHDAQTDEQAAAEGYVAAFTIDARPVRRTDSAMALPRYLMTDACDTRCMNGLLRSAGGSHD